MIVLEFMILCKLSRNVSKNYNSLKTCMDDSNVSLSVQNKVRSYLVYA